MIHNTKMPVSRQQDAADLLPRPVGAFVVKEIKTFFRDQTQWTQLFHLSALVVIYRSAKRMDCF